MIGYKHDDIINLIKVKLINDNVFHALLIYGASGSGKTFLSNKICKILLGLNIDKCSDSTNLESSDTYILEDNTSLSRDIITVDEVRKIKQWMSLSMLKSKYKVLLINDVDRMNINASNAFLKILEEPIGNTIIILNTSKIEALPLTLKSRCIKLRLQKKSIEEFIKILSSTFPSKSSTELEGLYKLCNGDINLATRIIKDNYPNFSMQFNDKGNCNQLLEYVSQLNLENSNDLKLFTYLSYYSFSTIIHIKINNDQQLDNPLFFKIDKIKTILSNIYHLNKTYSKELIIDILRECII